MKENVLQYIIMKKEAAAHLLAALESMANTENMINSQNMQAMQEVQSQQDMQSWQGQQKMPAPESLHQAVMYRLLGLCRLHNLGISGLAKQSGVPVTTIKNILNGASLNTGVNTLYKLCGGFGITMGEFFDDEIFAAVDEAGRHRD